MMPSDAVKLARIQARENDKQRVMAVLLDQRVISALALVGGVYAVEKITFSDNEGRNQRLKSAALAALIYAALSQAGAKGWPAAVASLVGGVGLGSSGGGTPWSPLQAVEATTIGAGLGTVVPGVGTVVGGGVGLGIDTIYQWVT
jgi:hypothetical protein